ncbi:hypothetical protein [Streptomyces malaysiensis]|uniref:Uncharacterized protein n=1 Tax=Streptomyces malaysiensis subsp. samsunensis TaxID=459658 RepID=A0A9X2M3U2_STRMQ|nr:hypothetical protein [Streptomyces samsunensis]MCQ8834325.1 hypothetical protein [Streptomyces samsunensis]
MVAQTGEHVVAVLPDGLDDDERGVLGYPLEDLDPGALAVDEPVPLGLVDRVAAAHLPAQVGEGRGEVALQLLLGGPAGDVGGGAQIAAGHGVDGVRLGGERPVELGQGVRGHAVSVGGASMVRAVRGGADAGRAESVTGVTLGGKAAVASGRGASGCGLSGAPLWRAPFGRGALSPPEVRALQPS